MKKDTYIYDLKGIIDILKSQITNKSCAVSYLLSSGCVTCPFWGGNNMHSCEYSRKLNMRLK